MQALIFGCGPAVRHIAAALVEQRQRVTVLDEHRNCPRVDGSYLNAAVVPSSGALIDDMRRCDVDHTDILLALSSNDNRNAMAAQIADRIYNVPKVICHVADASKYMAYKDMGLKVVSSTQVLSEDILEDIRDLR